MRNGLTKTQIAMLEKQKEQARINKFNKSESGKALHEKIHDLHRKKRIDPETLPF